MAIYALWNLFLAALPIALALPLARRVTEASGGPGLLRPTTLLLAGAWLLLLPNAPYLLTDIRHLLFDAPWRDLLARAPGDPAALRELLAWGVGFVGFGAAGVLAFSLALAPVETALRARWPRLRRLRAPFFLVIALGVWLGLVPRWNSWDALLHPTEVLGSAFWALTHPATAACIVAFAMVLCGMHYLLVAAWTGWRVAPASLPERS